MDLYSIGRVVKSGGRCYVQMRALLIGQCVWHPLLGECVLQNGRQIKGVTIYSELLINVSVRSLVPIRYECIHAN